MPLTAAKRSEKISAAEAASLVRDGMWLDYGVCIGQPDVFDQALGVRARELTGVKNPQLPDHAYTRISRTGPQRRAYPLAVLAFHRL